MSILGLYSSILVTVMTEWIDDASLCHLDTAVCSKTRRAGFLKLLSICKIYNVIEISNVFEHYEWVSARGIRLKTLYLDKYNPNHPLFASPCESHYHRVVTNCSTVLNGVEINSLKVNGDNEELLINLLKGVRGIEHLDVSVCYLSDPFMRKLGEYCPELKSLTTNSLTYLRPALQIPGLRNVFHCNLSDLLKHNNTDMNSCCIRQVEGPSNQALEYGGKWFILTDLKLYKTFPMDGSDAFESYLVFLQSFTTVVSSPSLANKVLSTAFLLTSLDVCGAFSTLILFAFIEKASMLKELHLRSPRVPKEVFDILAKHSRKLEKLTYCGTGLIEQNLVNLFNCCTNLTELIVLQEEEVISDTLVMSMADHLTSHLFLSGMGGSKLRVNHRRGGKELIAKSRLVNGNIDFSCLPMLHTVALDFIRPVFNANLNNLVDSCPLLASVCISNCPSVSDISMLARCRCLKSLQLSEQPEVTDAQIETVIRDKPSFAKLHLLSCAAISGDILFMIPQHCPGILHVHVSYNKEVHAEQVILLLQGCPKLNVLILNGCSNVNASIFATLRGRKMREVSLKGTAVTVSEWITFVKTTGFICSYTF